MYGSYLQMLDPIHNQGLRLCLGTFRTSPLESLYIVVHEPCLGARRAKLSLQYASKIKSLPKHLLILSYHLGVSNLRILCLI